MFGCLKKIPIHWRAPLGIAVGIMLGIISGYACQSSYSPDRIDVVLYDLIGSMFLRSLRMIVVPLMFTSLVLAAIEMSGRSNVGKLGIRCLLYVLCTSSAAVLIGLGMFSFINPGSNFGPSDSTPSTPDNNPTNPSHTKINGVTALLSVFLALAPPNIIDAMAKDQMLGIITFAILFGLAIGFLHNNSNTINTNNTNNTTQHNIRNINNANLESSGYQSTNIEQNDKNKDCNEFEVKSASTAIYEYNNLKNSATTESHDEYDKNDKIKNKKEVQKLMIDFFTGCNLCILWIINWILSFLPLGVCCLIAMQTSKSLGDNSFFEKGGKIISFTLTVILGLLTHAFVLLSLVLFFIVKINPLKHFKAVYPALIAAASTASTAASLPIAFDCLEKKAKVSKKICSFSLPLSCAINMNGSALFECVVILFLANIQNIKLTFQDQFIIVLLSLLTSVGVASVPSASLVAILLIIEAVNSRLKSYGSDYIIQTENIALIMLVNHPLDMLRSCVNMLSDTVCCVVVAKLDGEELYTKKNQKVEFNSAVIGNPTDQTDEIINDEIGSDSLIYGDSDPNIRTKNELFVIPIIANPIHNAPLLSTSSAKSVKHRNIISPTVSEHSFSEFSYRK